MIRSLTTAFIAAFLVVTGAGAAKFVPLPRPKPVQPIQAVTGNPRPPLPRPRPAISDEADTGDEAASAPPPPFDVEAELACERELTALGAHYQVGKDVTWTGLCGLRRPVHLQSLRGGVEIPGGAEVDCPMARALAHWMAEVVIPSAELHLKSRPTALHIGTSYQCRRRNGDATARMSEHAYGNAVDISGLSLADRGDFEVAIRTGDSSPDRAFQAAIRGGACAYFTTVLGPTTNEAHATHLHFDLAARRHGYRLCE